MDTVPSLEVKHAHARLELRERQLQELAGTMSELSTEEVYYEVVLFPSITFDYILQLEIEPINQ